MDRAAFVETLRSLAEILERDEFDCPLMSYEACREAVLLLDALIPITSGAAPMRPLNVSRVDGQKPEPVADSYDVAELVIEEHIIREFIHQFRLTIMWTTNLSRTRFVFGFKLRMGAFRSRSPVCCTAQTFADGLRLVAELAAQSCLAAPVPSECERRTMATDLLGWINRMVPASPDKCHVDWLNRITPHDSTPTNETNRTTSEIPAASRARD